MARVSEAEKRKSHNKIVDAASRLMREQGIEATSVSDVMKAAGLTHGGFYRHFESKDALVSAALRAAVEDVLSDMEAAPAGPQREAARAQYIARYLSEQHVRDRGKGCPLAALGVEIARQQGPVSADASEVVERTGRLLAAKDRGAPDQGLATMALLLGAVTLARLAGTQESARTILEAAKRSHELLERHW